MFDDVAPATVAWVRVLAAALVLLARRRTDSSDGGPAPSSARPRSSASRSALMNLCFYLAIDRIDLGKSVVIEFIGPIAVAAAFTRTMRNTVGAGAGRDRRDACCRASRSAASRSASAFIFCASTMWAAYIVVGRKVAALDRGVAGLGVGLAIGAVAIARRSACPGSGPIWASGDSLLRQRGCSSACSSNAVGYGIDQHVLRRIPVRRFALLLALLPVTAMVDRLHRPRSDPGVDRPRSAPHW